MGVTVERDLTHMFGPAREQGARPTCIAFAASDAHAAMRPGWVPLSCEFAYFHAVKHDGGGPDDGATLAGMLAALTQDGQPPEEAWAYLPQLPEDLALWKPPANAGPLFRRASEHGRAALATLFERLNMAAPVVITMCLSAAFYQPDAEGIIAADEPPDPKRRHAVVAVGYGSNGGERMILIRNSWGRWWGINGHAWMSEAYLAPRLYDLAELKEDLTNVSANRAKANVRSGVA